jgi:PAS domain S-box-containing protein
MLVVDPAGRIVLMNQQIQSIFGYRADELVGQSIDLLLPIRSRRVSEQLRAGLSAEERVKPVSQADLEFTVPTKSGPRRIALLSVEPVELSGVEHLLYLVHDLTRSRRTDRELRDATARLRVLMANAHDAIAILSSDGTILEANASLARSLGLDSPEQLVGRHLRVFTSSDRLLETLDSYDTAAATSGQLLGVKLRRIDGADATMDLSLSTVDVDGVRMVLAIGRDVTAQRSLEHQLLQSQKMEAVGRLAGGVAHDFNNMLTAVFGYTDVLIDALPPDSSARSYVGEIRKAGERASQLTRQLLAFSRQQVLEPVVVNPAALISEFQRMLLRVIGDDIELRLVCPPGIGNIRVDPGQLEQVLLNLVVNARDAMPNGGTVLIALSNEDVDASGSPGPDAPAPGSYVAIAVGDTGEGIAPDAMNLIFEPFFTTKAPGKGTGLGLSTVYGIIAQSGGHIRVASELGSGTTFTIHLPRSDKPEPAPAPLPMADLRSPTGTETILLVEDDGLLRPVTRMLLERLGYTVLVGENAAQAIGLSAAHRGPIDLLLTDVLMPGMSGRELAQVLAETRPEMPVLFVSGYTEEIVSEHGRLDSDCELLPKPYTVETLGRRIRDVLGGRR